MTNLARRLARLGAWERAIAAFAAGLWSVLALAPFHLWPALLVSFPALVWLLDGAAAAPTRGLRLRRAAAIGWWAGFGYFLGGLYWIGAAFLVEPEKYALLMPLAVTAMPAGLALFWALGAALAQLLWKPGGGRIAAFALGMFAAEWLRGHVLTGFPWNLPGYAAAGDEALLQAASLFGVYGLTLLSLFVFASPAAPFGRSGAGEAPWRARWLAPAIGALLLLAGEGWGAWRLAHASDSVVDGVRLRLVQANIPQKDKWNPGNRQWILNRYLQLTTREESDERATRLVKSLAARKDGMTGGVVTHVVWPESSVPFLFMMDDSIGAAVPREALAKIVPERGVLVLGAERAEGGVLADGRRQIERVFNSLFVVGRSEMADDISIRAVYDKVRLTPFGEYMPFEATLNRWGIRQLTHLPFSFTAGLERKTVNTPEAPPFSPVICYEVIFPGGVSGVGSPRPAWILNLTNDAWFGDSSGPYQHLDQAKMRAVEEGLPLARAANTGISAVIDGYGRIKAALPLDEIGTLDSPLPISLTPPLNTSWGNWTLSAIIMVILVLHRILQKSERPGGRPAITRKS